MTTHKLTLIPISTMLLATMLGCEEDENTRLAEMAGKHLDRQAQHDQQMIELQHEVAEGSSRLVEADARARAEMVALQREVQAERFEIGRQRDALEGERRSLAASRRLDPIVAAALTNVGLLLACLLPLVVCCYLLHRRVEPTDDQAIVDTVLADLVADQPLLLSSGDTPPAISCHDENDVWQLPDSSDRDGEAKS